MSSAPTGEPKSVDEPSLAIGRSLTGFSNSLTRTFQSGRTRLRRRGAELGLGPGQPKLLVYLTLHGPSGQRELADYFETDPSAISRMADALVRDGFVTSVPGHDRRARILAVTDRGRAAAITWDRVCWDEEQIMLDGFSIEERTAFADYLTRVRANLCVAEEAGDASTSGRLSCLEVTKTESVAYGTSPQLIKTAAEKTEAAQ